MSQAPLPPAPPPPARTPIFVIVVAVAVACTFILGILAAVAIPSFIKYMRRAKAAEAHTNIAALVSGLEVRFGERLSLPPSIPATPAGPAVGCAPRTWPPDAPAGWAELSFAPVGALRYAYSIDTAPDGRSAWVRAVGDLDCDGIFGRFERSVAVASDGRLVVGPLIRTDELE